MKNGMLFTVGVAFASALFAAPEDLVGSWGITIPAGMDKVPEKVAHLIVTKNAKGDLEGSLLWRWGSPEKVLSIAVDGNRFST